MEYIKPFDEFISIVEVNEKSKSLTSVISDANKLKAELQTLKGQLKGTSGKVKSSIETSILNTEEKLRRVAKLIMSLRADESLNEAKTLMTLQRSLNKLQNDYEKELDDEALDALSDFIIIINNKIKEK